MNKKQFLNAVNKIDDKFVNELINVSDNSRDNSFIDDKPQKIRLNNKRAPIWKIGVSAAAAVCVLAAGVFGVSKLRGLPSTPSDSVISSDSDTDPSSQIIGDESHINILGKNFTADMDLPTDIPSELPGIRLTLRKWDKDFIKKTFIEGKNVVDEWDNDSTAYPGERYFGFETEDGFYAGAEPGRFYYEDRNTKSGEFKYGSVYGKASNEYMVSGEELSAFSSGDAVKRVNKVLDELGITNYGTPRISPIKAEFANEILRQFDRFADKNGDPIEYTLWTENEEAYYLCYPLIYNSVELAVDALSFARSMGATDGSRVEAVVTKDEVIYIAGFDIYSEQFETTENIPVNYSARQASEMLSEHYENLVLNEPHKFNKCRAVYLPVDASDDHLTVSFRPAWEFVGCYEPEELSGKYEIKEYFFADTGYRYIGN